MSITANIANEAITSASSGVSKLYEDGKQLVSNSTETILAFPSKIGGVVETVESFPLSVAEHVDKARKSSNALVKVPEQVQSTLGDIAAIATESIAKHGDDIQKGLNDGAKNVTGSIGRATLEGFKAIPFVGVGVAAGKGAFDTAVSLTKSFQDLGGVATKIVNDITEKAKLNIATKTDGQTGGAKTRRHLKKMIRDRQLIQTRTNKMIHDFTNPKPQTKKNMPKKKTMRRRRR
jgi:hypothetical protein